MLVLLIDQETNDHDGAEPILFISAELLICRCSNLRQVAEERLRSWLQWADSHEAAGGVETGEDDGSGRNEKASVPKRSDGKDKHNLWPAAHLQPEPWMPLLYRAGLCPDNAAGS